MSLTGRPKLGGALLPYADLEGWLDVRWEDESLYREYADGTRELVEARFRFAGSATWSALSWTDLKQIHGLTQAPFPVVPRTYRVGDTTGIPELWIPCRRTGPLQETTPVWRRNVGTGAPLYAVEIEFESVGTYERIPQAIEGGVYLLEENEHDVEVETWGTASFAEASAGNVTFLGTPYAITTATLLPPELEALLLQPVPGDDDSVFIDFLNDFKAPTVP